MLKKWRKLVFGIILMSLPFIFSCILEPPANPTYYIAVISPRSDTILQSGRYCYILWRSNLTKYPSVSIALQENGTIVSTITGNTENKGIFYWKIPSTIPSGDNYAIEVTGIGETALSGTSAFFSIRNKADSYEPDDSISIATEISTDGIMQTHTLAYPGDIDWFKFTATAGQSYLIQSSGTPRKAVSLYGANGILLQYPNYSIPSVVWTCKTTGTYFFKVSTNDTSKYYYNDTLPYTVFVKNAQAFLLLVSPKSNETDTAGKPLAVRWQSTSNVTYVALYLTRNDSIIASVPHISTYNQYYDWILPLSLAASVNYRLKIINEVDSSLFCVSNFFTIASREYSLVVKTPNKGTIWGTGASAAINWVCTGLVFSYSFSNIKVALYRDSAYILTITSSINSDYGTCSWQIPWDLPASAHYKIKLSCVGDSAVSCFSEEFTITPTPAIIQILSPADGVSMTTGDTMVIEWTTSGKPVSTVRIGLYDSTKLVYPIVNTISASYGRITWKISSTIHSGDYRIKITAGQDSTAFCTRNISITKVPAYFTITSPVSGSSCSGTCTICWLSTGPVGSKVNIDLWNDSTLVHWLYQGYQYVPAIATSYICDIPISVPQGNRYRIKLKASDDTTIQAFSDGFTIVPVPKVISITSPSAGDIYVGGQNIYVTWTSTGLTDRFSRAPIFTVVLLDSTKSIQTLWNWEENQGLHYMKAPSNLPTKSSYQIKITSCDYPSISAYSGYFTMKNN